MEEILDKEGISEVEVATIWSTRRSRMELRREYFESLWRSGISSFFQGIIGESINGSRPLYNTLYEQYDFSLFSRDGLRFNNLQYPLIHSIVMRALAAEVKATPNPKFIAVNNNDQSKPMAFRHLFNQVLYEMNSEQENFEILLDKRILGSSISMVYTEEYEVKVKDPVYDKKKEKMTYEKKTKKIKQCKYRKLDLRHVLLDEHCIRTDLDDCNYAIVDEYYSKEDFLLRFAKYPNAKLLKAAEFTVDKDDATAYYNWFDTKDAAFIRVSFCYDKIYDVMHVIANNILLNEVDTPIPRIAGRKGKDIPLALAVQYKIPGAPYGYGDAHVTRSFNQIKNIIRVMLLEITEKSAKPMLAIDPLSNFDEQGFEWGVDFIRVAPNDLHEIKINPDLKSLYEMDDLTDQDVIRVTGININDTSASDEQETARKTLIRRESQNALINLTMGYMADSFFMRLFTLMKDEIRLHYGTSLKNGDEVKVRTEDVMLGRTGDGFYEEKVDGFRYFDLKEGDVDFDMELDLELGNIASSRELEKAIVQESMAAITPFIEGFNIQGVAAYLKETYEMPDEVLTQQNTDLGSQDPKALADSQIPPELIPQKDQQMQAMMQPPQPIMPPQQ